MLCSGCFCCSLSSLVIGCRLLVLLVVVCLVMTLFDGSCLLFASVVGYCCVLVFGVGCLILGCFLFVVVAIARFVRWCAFCVDRDFFLL